jgi:hypothetical protein
MISIKGLDKAEVLQALYDRARTQGMGIFQYIPGPLSKEEAQSLLQTSSYFDYLKGRVMKIDMSGDEIDPRLYDRDNGEGAAEAAISKLNSPSVPRVSPWVSTR